MNNHKISYTVKWSQPYIYSAVIVNLTELIEASVEKQLALGSFPEAVAVINKIRNKNEQN
jgi:hypothetical protein